ncbi:MAG TPA: AbrB/MazE/SpoVT family DNA-binding domain-containing protein [Myxococcota bacterium]|nr:AbrB/MazE/SpoVT family DNA-binding domain-containing protein [Myxococcota bacterium]
MIALKIRKLGNSMGVVLPKEILGRLHVEQGDTIFITESPEGFLITPYDLEFARQMELAKKVMKEDRDILRALAK